MTKAFSMLASASEMNVLAEASEVAAAEKSKNPGTPPCLVSGWRNCTSPADFLGFGYAEVGILVPASLLGYLGNPVTVRVSKSSHGLTVSPALSGGNDFTEPRA